MKILVPVDGSRYSTEALRVAMDYAKTKDANICLISVSPSFAGIDLEISASEREKINQTLEKQAENTVNEACNFLSKEDVMATCKAVVTSTSVPDAIIDYAEKERIDLIIMGSKGLSPSSRFRLGSVASKVVRYSPCSVHVVKLGGS